MEQIGRSVVDIIFWPQLSNRFDHFQQMFIHKKNIAECSSKGRMIQMSKQQIMNMSQYAPELYSKLSRS